MSANVDFRELARSSLRAYSRRRFVEVIMEMNMKKTLCLDFDGVIHSYTTPWQGAATISDPPVPGAIEFLTEAMAHFNVAIFSSRNHQAGGITAMRDWLAAHGVPWYLLDRIDFPQEKPPAHLTIDDRAMTFTGVFPTFDEIKDFKPWNK